MTTVLCLQYIFAEVKKEKVPGIIHYLFGKGKHIFFLSLISDNLIQFTYFFWNFHFTSLEQNCLCWRRLHEMFQIIGFSAIDKYEFKLFHMNENNTGLILFVLIIV